MFTLLPTSPILATGINNQLTDYYGPLEKSKPSPATFSYSQENDYKVFSFNGKLKRSNESIEDDYFTAGIRTSYGQLFSSQGNGFLGFGYFTTRIDTDNNIRFNTSISHLIPDIGSELFVTYRLFGANVSSTFDTLGYGEDHVYENSFAARCTTYSDIFVKEASIAYSYSSLPGQSLRTGIYDTDTQDHFRNTYLIGGFGDTESHAIGADLALGTDNLPLDLLHGFKIDLGVDYEHISYARYYDIESEVIQGMSGKASLQHKTNIGLLKGSYKMGQTSSTLYAGLHVGAMELYMKDTSYDDGDRNQVYGLKLKLNLYELESSLVPDDTPLFKPPGRRYTNVGQIHHNDSMTANSFYHSPKIHVAERQIYARK
ncbi:hypothetical protein [Desulfogranum japonicum]|uniref:hypothetical protein n=1 Tax=Desulfogranum japonicum TaxID=231447 RepID=UPI00129465E5|nr:hypothetical protein [Desulfogranum japonicum]